MTIQSAAIVFLSGIALFLFVQTRADKARRELSRMAGYEYWTDRAFKAVRSILKLEDFPEDELQLIHKVISIIDRKSAALSLYTAIYHPNDTDREQLKANPYFDANPIAEKRYREFFYSYMMSVSYLDNFGDMTRPKIEEIGHDLERRPAEMARDLRYVEQSGSDSISAAAMPEAA